MDNYSTIRTPSELEDATKTIVLLGYPELDEHKIPPPPDLLNAGPIGPIMVRTEEVIIVVLLLILWAGAIALFFNRWGKIRMLEPYQPKFHEEEHRPSCPLIDLSTPAISQHRTSMSKYNVTANCGLDPPVGVTVGPIYQTAVPTTAVTAAAAAAASGYRAAAILRSRQNSVFATVQTGNTATVYCPRKTRSAVDINTLVLHENPTYRYSSYSRPATGPSPYCSSMLPIGGAGGLSDRRLSCAQHATAALKDKRSCSLFPPGAYLYERYDRRTSCVAECGSSAALTGTSIGVIGLRDRNASSGGGLSIDIGYKDSSPLTPNQAHAFRRPSHAAAAAAAAVVDHANTTTSSGTSTSITATTAISSGNMTTADTTTTTGCTLIGGVGAASASTSNT